MKLLKLYCTFSSFLKNCKKKDFICAFMALSFICCQSGNLCSSCSIPIKSTTAMAAIVPFALCRVFRFCTVSPSRTTHLFQVTVFPTYRNLTVDGAIIINFCLLLLQVILSLMYTLMWESQV